MNTEKTVWVHVLYSQELFGKTYTTKFRGAIVTEEETLPSAYCFYRTASFQVPASAFDSPRNIVHAVVGYYSDGDTFGTSHGHVDVVSVYGNPAKAHAVAQALLSTNAKSPSFLKGRRVAWGDYFSSLEKVEVETLTIIFDAKESNFDSSVDALNLEDW